MLPATHNRPTMDSHTIPSTRCTNQLRVTRPSRPQVRIDAGMLCDGKTIDAGHGMRQENWQVPRRQAKSEVLVRQQQSGDLEANSDADWGGDRATRRSVSAGVIMRGSRCLKVWTKKQQVAALMLCSQDGIRRAQDPNTFASLPSFSSQSPTSPPRIALNCNENSS